MSRLKITWVKSSIGRPANQKGVIRALGLRRLHASVVHDDSPTVRGMVNKISHLLTVQEVIETKGKASKTRRKKSDKSE